MFAAPQDTGFDVGPHNVASDVKVDADEFALSVKHRERSSERWIWRRGFEGIRLRNTLFGGIGQESLNVVCL